MPDIVYFKDTPDEVTVESWVVTGPPAQIKIGAVSRVPYGGSPWAHLTGTAPDYTLTLGIPEGAPSQVPGPVPTITVGTVTTGAPAVTVTPDGDNYRLNFTLPKGDKGDPGGPGAVANASSYMIIGPGVPTTPSSTGGAITGSEPVGAEYRSTTSTQAVWWKTASGWKPAQFSPVAADYDSGELKLTHPSITAGTVYLQRVGKVVSLILDGVVFGELSGTVVLDNLIPTGFRTVRWIPFASAPIYGPVRGIRTFTNGGLQVLGVTAGDALRASVMYITSDPVPA